MLNKIWPFSALRRKDEEIKALGWHVRTAFWEANQVDDWLENWRSSNARHYMVSMGYIDPEDTYR